MAITLRHKGVVSEGDTEMVAIDYTNWLDGSELLTGTPTVAEQGTSDLTISNKAVSTAVLTILDSSVSIGKAVQFKIQGQKAGRLYRIRVTVSTDGTPARTCVRDMLIECL